VGFNIESVVWTNIINSKSPKMANCNQSRNRKAWRIELLLIVIGPSTTLASFN
jgi:hypothetical protein